MEDKQNTIVVSVPGKIHLMGEHVVVYGKPALLTTIDKRLKLSISLIKENKIIIKSKNINKTITTTITELVKKTQKARKLLAEFQINNDNDILKQITASDFNLIGYAIVETFAYYRKQINGGFKINIDSDIPIGQGMGSSAALALAVVAGITASMNSVVNNNAIINEIAYLVERYQHGFPSGGDNTAITYGGLIWYRKESEFYKVIGQVPINIPNQFKNNFYLINTGKPSETTGEMVSNVKNLLDGDPKSTNEIFDNQEMITRNMLEVFKNADEHKLIQLIKQGHHNLIKLSVVSDSVRSFIDKLEASGGAGKISGAGGFKTNSGLVVVYHPNKVKFEKIIKRFKYDYFQSKLGTEGLKID